MTIAEKFLEVRKRVEKELQETKRKETQKIIESLNLQKIFQNEKRFNELNRLLNLDLIKEREKIIENLKKTSKDFNSAFNYMDSGKLDDNAKNKFAFKPLIMELLDSSEIEKNDSSKKEEKNDNVFEILKSSFKDKINFDEEGNLIISTDKKIEKDDSKKEENFENNLSQNNNQDTKKTNKHIQRFR